jgi:hypothetical protein
MKTLSLHLAALCGICLLSAEASTITLSSSPAGYSVYDVGAATPVANGNLLRVGTFSNPGALSLTMSISQMIAAGGWTEFGSRFTSSIFGNPGKLTGSIIDDSAAANFFNGKDLYIWAFNSPTTAAATATGIFRADGAPTPLTGQAWTFPVNTNLLDRTRTLTISDLQGGDTINGIGSVNQPANKLQLSTFGLVGVPEVSSTALFYSLAALVLFSTHRARRRA